MNNQKIYNYMDGKILNIELAMKDYNNYIYKIIRNNYNNFSDEDVEEIILDVFLTLWNNQNKLDINQKGCYVMNNKGEKFECTMSPSRKCNYNFIDGDKYDFYETYSMTKYDATDDITMVVNYRGTLEYIKLQKVK